MSISNALIECIQKGVHTLHWGRVGRDRDVHVSDINRQASFQRGR